MTPLTLEAMGGGTRSSRATPRRVPHRLARTPADANLLKISTRVMAPTSIRCRRSRKDAATLRRHHAVKKTHAHPRPGLDAYVIVGDVLHWRHSNVDLRRFWCSRSRRAPYAPRRSKAET